MLHITTSKPQLPAPPLRNAQRLGKGNTIENNYNTTLNKAIIQRNKQINKKAANE